MRLGLALALSLSGLRNSEQRAEPEPTGSRELTHTALQHTACCSPSSWSAIRVHYALSIPPHASTCSTCTCSLVRRRQSRARDCRLRTGAHSALFHACQFRTSDLPALCFCATAAAHPRRSTRSEALLPLAVRRRPAASTPTPDTRSSHGWLNHGCYCCHHYYCHHCCCRHHHPLASPPYRYSHTTVITRSQYSLDVQQAALGQLVRRDPRPPRQPRRSRAEKLL